VETEVLLRRIKKALLDLGDGLEQAEAIGICGSLARGKDFGPRSDIDVFVVVKEASKTGNASNVVGENTEGAR